MKKYLILASALLTFALPSFSQITPSSYAIGGSSTFMLSSSPSASNLLKTTFSINPEIGKFVSEKWYIGGGLGYTFQKQRVLQTLDETLTSHSNTFSGNFVATRYYPLSEKFYFTMEYGLAGSFSLFQNQLLPDSLVSANINKSVGLSIGASPGFAYFITNKWMLFTRLGRISYTFLKTLEFDNATHSLGYGFQGNSFGLGVRYVFGGK